MTGETSGPSDQDICMALLEQKFDDLLTFVHLMVKRDAENENRTEDTDKNKNKGKPEWKPEEHPTLIRVHHQHRQNLKKETPN